MPTRRSAARSRPTRSSRASARPSPASARQTVQRRLQPDQLAAGHQRVERRLLQRDADRAPHVGGLVDHVVAGDERPAAGRPQQRRQHPHRRRLAGAVGAEEARRSRPRRPRGRRPGPHAPRRRRARAHRPRSRPSGNLPAPVIRPLSYGGTSTWLRRRHRQGRLEAARHWPRRAPSPACVGGVLVVGSPGEAGGAKAKEIGKTKNTPKPSCPTPSGDPPARKECQVVGEVTGFQVRASGKKGLMKAQRTGRSSAGRSTSRGPTRRSRTSSRTSSGTGHSTAAERAHRHAVRGEEEEVPPARPEPAGQAQLGAWPPAVLHPEQPLEVKEARSRPSRRRRGCLDSPTTSPATSAGRRAGRPGDAAASADLTKTVTRTRRSAPPSAYGCDYDARLLSGPTWSRTEPGRGRLAAGLGVLARMLLELLRGAPRRRRQSFSSVSLLGVEPPPVPRRLSRRRQGGRGFTLGGRVRGVTTIVTFSVVRSCRRSRLVVVAAAGQRQGSGDEGQRSPSQATPGHPAVRPGRSSLGAEALAAVGAVADVEPDQLVAAAAGAQVLGGAEQGGGGGGERQRRVSAPSPRRSRGRRNTPSSAMGASASRPEAGARMRYSSCSSGTYPRCRRETRSLGFAPCASSSSTATCCAGPAATSTTPTSPGRWPARPRGPPALPGP